MLAYDRTDKRERPDHKAETVSHGERLASINSPHDRQFTRDTVELDKTEDGPRGVRSGDIKRNRHTVCRGINEPEEVTRLHCLRTFRETHA